MSKISLKEVLLCRDRSSHLKRLLLGMGGQFMQQMSGINALNYYFSIILQNNLGMSELMARVLTGANATSYCISTAMAFWIIDRRGRRFLMMTGLGLQSFAYIMVAIAVARLTSAPQQVGRQHNDGELKYGTNKKTVGSGCDHVLVLLLRSLRFLLGNGTMDLSSRSELPRYEDPRCCSCNGHKLGLRLRLHPIHICRNP